MNIKHQGGSEASVLMAVDLTVDARSDCNRRNSHNGDVTSDMFCAGPFEGGKDT